LFDVTRSAPKKVGRIRAIGNQASGFGEFGEGGRTE